MAIEDLELKLQQELSRRVVRLLPGNVEGYDGNPNDATGAALAIFDGATDTSEYTQSDETRWKKYGGVWYRDDFVGMPLVELTGAGETTVLGGADTNKRWHRVERTGDEIFELGPTSELFSAVIEGGASAWSVTLQPGVTYDGPTEPDETNSPVLIIALGPLSYRGQQIFGLSGGGGGNFIGRNSWDDPNVGTITNEDPTPDGPGITAGSIDFYGDGTLTYGRYDVSPILLFYSEVGGGDAFFRTNETGGGMLIGAGMAYAAGSTAELDLYGDWQEKIFGAVAGASDPGDWAGHYVRRSGMVLGGYVYVTNGSSAGSEGWTDIDGVNTVLGGYIYATNGFLGEFNLRGSWTRSGNIAYGRVDAEDADAGIYARGIANLVGGYALNAYIDAAGYSDNDAGNVAIGFADGFDIWTRGFGNLAIGHADGGEILADGLSNCFQFGTGVNSLSRSLSVLEAFRFLADGLPLEDPEVIVASNGAFTLGGTFTWDGTPVVIATSFTNDMALIASEINALFVTAGIDAEVEAYDASSLVGYFYAVGIRMVNPTEADVGKVMNWPITGFGYDVRYDATDSYPGTEIFTAFNRAVVIPTPRKGDFFFDGDALQIGQTSTRLTVAEEHDVIEVDASRDLALTDRNKTLNVIGAYTLTLTPAMAIKGMEIRLLADGVHAMTVQQDSGATITLTCPKGTVNDLAQDTVLSAGADGDELTLRFISATECRITGDVA